MKRRIGLVVALACIWTGLSGCRAWDRHGLRPLADPRAAEVGGPPPLDEAEPSEPAGPKGFFKPTRLGGALSEEGADIERSLGVGRR